MMLQLADEPANTRLARMDRRLFARCAAGDPRARSELIERFLPLARSLARRYERCGEPLEDLVQVASLALVKAIDGYDDARGVAFTSYAVPTIAGELKRYFPRSHVGCASLAAAVDATDEDVLEALQARGAYRGLSLQAPTGGQETQTVLQDTLGGSDDGYAQAEARVLLDGLLAVLPARSREVLRLRFEQDLTQAEIGALVGVSQMQISRIIRGAIDEIRAVAERAQPPAREPLETHLRGCP
jgi:RNA polymerase sigma-B factor